MTTLTLSVPNISCMHCVHTIQAELSELAGVTSVKADAQSKEVQVTFEMPASEAGIRSLLAEINYPAE